MLAPCLILLTVAAQAWGWADTLPNAFGFLQAVCVINIGLLIFNLLPIYPLDGGQILQALLWFVVGRARSLMVASIIGFGGVALLIGFAVLVGWRGHSVNAAWFGILAIFILLNCWRGLLQARFWARAAKLPRRAGYACPACKQPPVRGPIWRCAGCHQPFDLFESRAVCPHCGAQFPAVPCLDCGRAHPLDDWGVPPPLPPPLPEAPARA